MMENRSLETMVEDAPDLRSIEILGEICKDAYLEHKKWFEHYRSYNEPEEAASFLGHMRRYEKLLKRLVERKTDITWRLDQ